MADEPDFSHKPSGQLGWRELAEQICKIDPTAERHFLEIKSDVDLSTNEGRAKVAKFVQGAANRDPVTAVTRFDGHALMFLGIAHGATPGIPPFEALELQNFVRRFTGTPGPGWDFESISVANGRAVVIIVVDPPNPAKQPWVCQSEGHEKMFNGRIYIRADGNTREARGAEVDAMVARRSLAARPRVDIDVEVVGVVRTLEFDATVVEEWIKARRQTLLDALPKPKPPAERKQRTSADLLANTTIADLLRNPDSNLAFTALGGTTVPEDRTKEQYIAEIDAWAGEVSAMIPGLLDEMAGCAWPGVAFKVTNMTESYLEEPEIQVHVEGPVEALEKQDVRDMPQILREMPRPPRVWGPVKTNSFMDKLNYGSMISPAIPNLSGLTARGPNYGMVKFKNGGSVDLRFKLDALRPHAVASCDNDDFVLVLRDAAVSKLRARWTATVKGRDGRWQGELTVPIHPTVTSFTGFINKQLKLDEERS